MKINFIAYPLLLVGVLIAGFFIISNPNSAEMNAQVAQEVEQEPTISEVDVPEGLEVATFAAGCFWCSEAAYQITDGVVDVYSGYAGGQTENPTYEEVYKMLTDHREAVQILYDPSVITYDELVDELWKIIDPTDAGGQFVDRGFSYTAAIFYHNDDQKNAAEQNVLRLSDSSRFDGKEIITPIIPYTTFYRAEEYHQDFYIKSPNRYNQYESLSGREEYKAAVWQEIQNSSN